MADYRDPSATAITGLCLAVSVTTFLIAATFLVRKGLRAASFYSSVLCMVVPCVAVDVSLFTVDSEEKMSVWYLVRVAQMVFSSTLVVLVSIQRLKVFADAGLAEWLTDCRLRACLVSVLVLRAVLITLSIAAYAKIDPRQVWNDKSLERQLLSTVILGGDALGDMICTVIAFVLILRVRVAVLAMQARRMSAVPTARVTGRVLRKSRRFLVLFVGVVAAQMGMLLAVVIGVALTFVAPGFKGDAIGSLLERIYIFCAMTQWQLITELVKSHKTKGQAPVSDSCNSRGTSGPGPVTGDKIMPSPFNLSRHATQVSASTTRHESKPEPPSPVVPLLHGGSVEKVSPSASIPGRTGGPSTDSAVVDAVGG
ncbi:hypothetical protein GGF31_008122 [Allomyces arbusculus]|nr:hypothetical protein GGF31_008122 [Allomyces arbusculus]